MTNIRLAGMVFASLCVCSLLIATQAFALSFTLAEWLKNGVAITTNESVDGEGEFILENVLNGAAILCSGLFEGAVGANGTGSVTKIFDLTGKEIPELDETGATNGPSCTGVKVCENGSEAWPVKLPYKITLNLDTGDGKFYVTGTVTVNPADALLCLFLGSSIEELCETASEAFGEVVNVATDIEAKGAIEPLGTCSGNAEDGLVFVDSGLMSLLNGTLTVSN